MAPWAQRNCFRRRMIVEDIRFRFRLDIASLKILCGLFFFCGGKVCTFTEKLNCEKCNGLQILLNFLNINLEKVLHLSSVHSSLVDYLIQAIAWVGNLKLVNSKNSRVKRKLRVPDINVRKFFKCQAPVAPLIVYYISMITGQKFLG